jgi:2-deoxy-D-gluconate 3-dehydrogenase
MITLPPSPSFSLHNRRALVTGASSGIGLGIATALARAGAHVVCAARRENLLNALVQALHNEKLKAQACTLDISNVKDTEHTLNNLPPFDIVVNSAGMARHGPALLTQEDDFNQVVSANLKGAYFLSTLTAQRMIDHNIKGSIIHISSQMGHIGGTERAVYCATKHGVEGMIKAMAIEWGHHDIRINSIAPTFILTELTKSSLERPEIKEWVSSKIKLPRLGEVSDIMGAALYLASDAASMVTGTSILVDGGWTAG